VLCGKAYGKDEMYHVEIDEPGAKDWVCETCYEAAEGDYDGPPNHPDE